MNKYKKNIKNRNKCIFLSIIILISIFIFISPSYSATINIDHNATNQNIQGLIDSAKSGDTIQFKNSTYNNISLIIDKKLTLKGNGTTIITKNFKGNSGNAIDGSNTFGFYFTKSALGSSLIGFNIISNSDYGIIVNSSSVTMTSNTINGGQKGGVLFNNSKDSKVNNNIISNSGGYGIYIIGSTNINTVYNNIKNNNDSGVLIFKSSNIRIYDSSILNNKNHGIEVILSNYTSIINNKIEDNYDGIFLSNTKITNITNNFINNNKRNGINLNGITEKTYIINNTISKNANGIQLNGKSVNDVIKLNIIKEQKQTSDTDLDMFETGNGIVIGDDYDSSSTVTVEYNSILNNENFGIKNKPQFDEITFGPNYFGENGNHICPRILASFLTAKISISGEVNLYDGKKMTGYNIGSDGRIYSASKTSSHSTSTTKPANNGSNNVIPNSNGNLNNPSLQNGTSNGKIQNNTNSPKKTNNTDNQYSVGDSGKPLLSKAYEIISDQISRATGENSIFPYLILLIIAGIFGFGYLKKRKI